METPTLILQPYDGDWRMGEDFPLQCPLDITVVALMKLIEQVKGIPAYRQQIRLPSGKVIPKSREIWALRRHGIQNESSVRVEPTRPGAWLWHESDYYVRKLLGEVVDILSSRAGPAQLDEVEKLVSYPPCFPYSLRIFLRHHPDIIRFRSDITSSKIWICLAKALQLPSYEHVPIDLGTLPSYDPTTVEWEDYSDIDSMRPIESSVTLPDVDYDIAISCGRGLACNGEVTSTNPFVVILLDGKYVGHSKVKMCSRGPLWMDARFRIGLPFGCTLGDYKLSFEVWNFEKAVPVAGQALQKNIVLKRLQYLDISKSDMSDFLQPDGANVFRDYALASCAQEEVDRKKDKARLQAEAEAELAVESGLLSLEENEGGDSEEEPPPSSAEPAPANSSSTGQDDAKKSDDYDEDDDDEKNESKKRVIIERPVFNFEDLLATSLDGQLTLMGSRAIYQLQVRAAFELFSHETEISDDIQPFIIVVWNGVDIGQTPFLKFTRWASWHDSIFNIPVPGSMEPGQCTLIVQVWNMDKIGGGKKLMSSLTLTSKALRDFLTKKTPFANREQFELTLPVKGDEEGRTQGAKKKKGADKKGKNAVVAGYVALTGGLVGLQENNLELFEMHFLVGGNMARSEVVCVLQWNSVEIGRTDSAPRYVLCSQSNKLFLSPCPFMINICSVTEKVNKKLTTVKWYWKRNKFIFGIPSTENMADVELKIDCFDPTTKGSGSFVGCVILTGEEITALLHQDWAVLQQVTLKKDPKRDDKQRISKGTINLRCGRLGSRLETERVVEMKACHSLAFQTNDDHQFPLTTQYSCYCVVYWNNEIVGKTKPVRNDGNPVWEIFDDRWCMAREVLSSPMYYAASELFVEVWELCIEKNSASSSDQEEENEAVFLGSCWLTGQPLQELLESLRPATVTLPLYNKKKPTAAELKEEKKRKKKKGQPEEPIERMKGFLVLGTPGIKDKTPLEDIERTESLYNLMLKNEIERNGMEIFEDRK
jgi:hypothetical protein